MAMAKSAEVDSAIPRFESWRPSQNCLTEHREGARTTAPRVAGNTCNLSKEGARLEVDPRNVSLVDRSAQDHVVAPAEVQRALLVRVVQVTVDRHLVRVRQADRRTADGTRAPQV